MSGSVSHDQVRAWAHSQGIPVTPHGVPVQQSVIAKYRRKHPGTFVRTWQPRKHQRRAS